jgi:hypothetical protein
VSVFDSLFHFPVSAGGFSLQWKRLAKILEPWYDNNRAEREIRPAVIARKNSFHNTSNQGAWTQAVLMTIYRTLKLRGQDPIETIADVLTLFIATGKLPGLPTAKPPGLPPAKPPG